MEEIWDKVKNPTILFSGIYLTAWALNGYSGMHFNCADLMTWYGAVIVKQLGVHYMDSKYNSDTGKMPEK